MVSVSFYLGHSYAMTFVTRDKCLLQRVLYLRPKWVAIKAVKVWHAQKACWPKESCRICNKRIFVSYASSHASTVSCKWEIGGEGAWSGIFVLDCALG